MLVTWSKLRSLGLSVLSAMMVISFSFTASAYSDGSQYPSGPDATLTPGSLCSSPDSHRYPEQIPYCSRDVSSELKRSLFVKYDQIGFRTRDLQRGDFKIDHYIPLCMGGSNEESNLWPQYKKIYAITDPLEPVLCEKMSEGRLTQKKAVEYITYGKNHLNEVPRILAEVERL
ncbi:MAG: HNH endonuclease [Proteobacteria bacterium]|nr:MAG: HNH endonuclease [Pseudomonadota bacterium]